MNTLIWKKFVEKKFGSLPLEFQWVSSIINTWQGVKWMGKKPYCELEIKFME